MPRSASVAARHRHRSAWLGALLLVVAALPAVSSAAWRDDAVVTLRASAGPEGAILVLGGVDPEDAMSPQWVQALADTLRATSRGTPADSVDWYLLADLTSDAASDPVAGRLDRPFDSDADGRLDEDPPADRNGDGLILQMLVPTPAGTLGLDRDGYPIAYAESLGQRFAFAPREGRDRDRDGKWAEDGPRGILPDLNFPLDAEQVGDRAKWSLSEWRDAGPYPACTDAVRGLCDFVLAHPEIRLALILDAGSPTALEFPPLSKAGAASSGDGDGAPGSGGSGAAGPSDRSAYAELARLAKAHLDSTLAAAPAEEAKLPARWAGSITAGLYRRFGVLAVRNGLFGVEIAKELTRAKLPTAKAEVGAPDMPDYRFWAAFAESTGAELAVTPFRATETGPDRAWIGGIAPLSLRVPPTPFASTRRDRWIDFARSTAAVFRRPEIAADWSGNARGGVVRVRISPSTALPVLGNAAEATRRSPAVYMTVKDASIARPRVRAAELADGSYEARFGWLGGRPAQVAVEVEAGGDKTRSYRVRVEDQP